ncbi:hypothetical protein AAKU55_003521 [Oxalobacteraceae bacterium GrIS 1.11]
MKYASHIPGKSTERNDYDEAPRPLGMMPKNYPDGFRVGMHRHRRGQFIYAASGATPSWPLPATRADSTSGPW